MEDINLIRNEKGTTLVETSIIIMLLLILIFGIVEFGLLLFNRQVLTNASRAGARAGVVIGLGRTGGDAAEFITESNNMAFGQCSDHLVTFGSGVPYIDSDLPYYIDKDGNGFPSRGDNLTLHLRLDYNFLFLSAFGIGPVQLKADTIMRLE